MSVSSVRLIEYRNPYVKFGQQISSQNEVSVCSNPIKNLSPEQKLNSIISHQELKKYYDSICKSLNLDINPTLNIVPKLREGWGGGYNFLQNQINLSLEELTIYDYKIVGKKGNIIEPLVDKKTGLPLFASVEMLTEFINIASKNNNYGYDLLYIKPTTLQDKKRKIIQKLSHELIHAQQHLIMRKTVGIGEKEILKAWAHFTPKNSEDIEGLKNFVDKKFKESFWADKAVTSPQIPRFSPHGLLAYKWLYAIKNYPKDITSMEYYTNELEKDAYRRSAKCVQSFFGPLEA